MRAAQRFSSIVHVICTKDKVVYLIYLDRGKIFLTGNLPSKVLLVYCLCTVVTESLEKKVKQGSEVFTGVFFLDIKLNIKKLKPSSFHCPCHQRFIVWKSIFRGDF